MSVSFYIAKRYLLSKKSHSAINLISGVSVCGVAIATAALVCILSVFNGFQDMVAGLFTAMDPELKVVPAVGKFMAADAKGLAALREDADVEVLTETLEDQALHQDSLYVRRTGKCAYGYPLPYRCRQILCCAAFPVNAGYVCAVPGHEDCSAVNSTGS